MLIETVVNEFISDGKYRKLSDRTTSMYRITLKLFTEYCHSQGITKFIEIDSNLLKSYVIYLSEVKNNNSGGIAYKFRVIRALFGFANREDIENSNPFKRFRMPKIDLRVMEYIESEEYSAMIQAARVSSNPLRDTAVISILFDTGIRVGELLNLKLDDILNERGFLKVDGKTGERLVPCSRPVVRRITQYINSERSHSLLKEVFLSDAHTPMTYQGVVMMLQRTSKRAGVKYKSPHCYRRGFCTAMVKNGADLFSIQRSMGHKTLAMTNRYAVLNEESLKAVHLVAAPTKR